MVLSSAWDKSIIAFALWGTPRMLQPHRLACCCIILIETPAGCRDLMIYLDQPPSLSSCKGVSKARKYRLM